MKRKLIITALALGVTACGPSIRITRDRAMPVPTGVAWTWGASDAGRTFPEKHPMVDNATVRARIERVLAEELDQKGFTRAADTSSARLLVHFHIGVEERHELVGNDRPPCVEGGCGLDWGYWGRPEGSLRQINYEAGQLMVDIVDRETRKIIWRGLLENDFVKTDVEESRLRNYVHKLLRSLPKT